MKRSLMTVGAAFFVSVFMVGGAFAQISPHLPAPGEAPAGSPVAKHGALKVSGSQIVDKNNEAVTLRGMSLFWANTGAGDQYYNENVIAWLVHDWKVSVIRAAIGVAKTDGTFDGNVGYADGDSAGMVNKAMAIIEACIRRGTYVLVDWHTHNAGAAAGRSAKGAEFLGNIAKKYGQYPNVLFEPFNEPLQVGANDVVSYVTPIVSAIRQSSNNIIIVGSPSWSQQPNNVTVSGTNIAYSLHFYTRSHPLSSLSGNITSAKSAGKAVVVTEFGTTHADGGSAQNPGVDLGGTNSWISFLETNKVGWMNWSICHLSESSAALTGSGGGSGGPWAESILSQSGRWARDKIREYNNSTYYTNTKYSINVTEGTGGTLQKKVGNTVNNGPYDFKTVVSVKAVPNTGWEFQSWTGDASGSSDSLATTILGVNLTVGAKFYNGGVIKNGHFTFGTGSWSAAGNVVLTPLPAATIARDGSQMKVTITEAGANPTDLYVYQTGLKLEQGKKYELSFEAKGASARKIYARVSNGRTASSTVYLNSEVALTTTLTLVKRTFDMGSTITNGRLDFDIGGDKTGLFITNVKLLDIGQGSGVARGAVSGRSAGSWSVASVGGVPVLRGPAETGATVYLYDTRGKLVKSMSAVNGLNLGGAGLSAGNYLSVVKNASGAEVLRSRVVMTR